MKLLQSIVRKTTQKFLWSRLILNILSILIKGVKGSMKKYTESFSKSDENFGKNSIKTKKITVKFIL